MKNPILPYRKIRHAELLTKAGFKIDLRWYTKEKLNNPNNIDCNVNRLIYWINNKNETITLFDYQQISLKSFLERYSAVVKYNFKKHAQVTFDE